MSDYPLLTREFLETLTKAELIEIILHLDKRIAVLERQAGMNSRNSSNPPSSDGPEVAPPTSIRKTGKRRGAQPGHEGHVRGFVSSDKVSEIVDYRPDVCRRCGKPLVGNDPNPNRHQVWEIPDLAPTVREYRFHSLRCTCGALTTPLSSEVISKGMFGPNLTSLAALFTGAFHISKRSALEIINTVFNCPMSLGGLSSCEEEASESLREISAEIHDTVLSSPVVHADETSFRLGNKKKGWLWVAVGAGVAFFLLHAKRGIDAATTLLRGYSGVLVSDRWGGYNRHGGQRQYCWAHVKRDFTRISEMRGEAGTIGEALLDAESRVFSLWHRVRDGTMSRAVFQNRVQPLRRTVQTLLRRGSGSALACSGMCVELLKAEARLWTFVRIPGVEPTNNLAERSIRPAVLWRKNSFGVQSERGKNFVERMLTVHTSCRMQKIAIVNFIKEAVEAKRNGKPAPSIVAQRKQAEIAK